MNEITPDFMEEMWIRRVFVSAGHALLFYDYFLTLGKEAKCIWGAPWTPVKTLFLISRYGNLIGQSLILAGESGVLNYYSPEILLPSVRTSAEVSHALVLMRAWAMWRCRKTLLGLLMAFYIAVIVAVLAVSTIDVLQSSCRRRVLSCLVECNSTNHFRTVPMISTDGAHRSALLQLLFRDGQCCTWYILHNMLSPKYLLPPALTLPVVSITSQRIVLNLRSLKANHLMIHELSREIDRQIDAFLSDSDVLHQLQPIVLVDSGMASVENHITASHELTDIWEERRCPSPF
ncbi:hypothetical protein J3A83DRAFT_4194552 [Scleroderma citrinum]